MRRVGLSEAGHRVIEVEIEDEGWVDLLPDVRTIVEAAIRASLKGRGDGDVVVLLADDAAVQALNSQFRRKDSPTNVLSFPAPPSASPHLGDIVLGLGVCTREAGVQNKRLRDHVSHLTAHGVLHLLGYDHQCDADAEVMEDVEREILATLGAPDPYRLDGSDVTA